MIRTVVEGARGCGYRKEGGLYLVSGQPSEPCPLIPYPLESCPHCGSGIKPSRSFTWITPSVIIPASEHGLSLHNDACPLGTARRFSDGTGVAGFAAINFRDHGHKMGERAGLIWVGVVLAHRKAIRVIEEATITGVSMTERGSEVDGTVDKESFVPGAITMFRPHAIEYVVKGTETEEEIEALEKRGLTLVKVVRDDG
jgi:hypothetical protein